VLATTVAADAVVARDSSFISLPMVRNIPPPGSVNLARHRKRFEKRRLSNPNVGTKDLSFVYTISIGVGTPPTKCESCRFLPGIVSYMFISDDLIVDTGSSNTWLGANKPYTITNTSVETRDVVVSILSRAHS
jgi:cathepsin E